MSSFLDDIMNIDPVCRKHYGDDEKNPPKLPEKEYYWDNNSMSFTYGWNESDHSFRKRVLERMNKEK